MTDLELALVLAVVFLCGIARVTHTACYAYNVLD